VSSARWLIDKSALWRTRHQIVSEALWWRTQRGLVGVSIATELEIGFSAEAVASYQTMRTNLVDQLVPVALPYRAEGRAREVQATLVDRGQHRAVGVPDLLIAATAEVEGLTVLHYDADFDQIAAITGQPCEWIVPAGSI
jgi:predicted nucleic acid-binding protein